MKRRSNFDINEEINRLSEEIFNHSEVGDPYKLVRTYGVRKEELSWSLKKSQKDIVDRIEAYKYKLHDIRKDIFNNDTYEVYNDTSIKMWALRWVIGEV